MGVMHMARKMIRKAKADIPRKGRFGKLFGLLILIAALVVGGAYGYNFWYESEVYYKTDNAAVTADSVTITPLMTGPVAGWYVAEGDAVMSGQTLGKQDLEYLVQSSAVSASQLEQSAGVAVSRAEIKTPISGKVVQSNVIVGETVAPGMTVAVVADTANMYIIANVEETQINRISIGQRVEITIDAYPRKKFTGFVESIGETTQSAFGAINLNTSGSYSKVMQLVPVKINVADLNSLSLRMGYNATVKIRVKEEAKLF